MELITDNQPGKYYFETREFGVSDQGIHLLRSRFNYMTIDYNQVDNATVEKGKEMNNWLAILIIGCCLLLFAFYYSIHLIRMINNPEVTVIYIEAIVIPLIPSMIGGYCLWTSLRNGIILKVTTIKNKKEKFPLKELEKQETLVDFQNFLKKKLPVNSKISL